MFRDWEDIEIPPLCICTVGTTDWELGRPTVGTASFWKGKMLKECKEWIPWIVQQLMINFSWLIYWLLYQLIDEFDVSC